MVKVLSFPDRLRTCGKTIFKEIRTRGKKLKEELSFDAIEHDAVVLEEHSFSKQFANSSEKGLEKLHVQLYGEDLARLLEMKLHEDIESASKSVKSQKC